MSNSLNGWNRPLPQRLAQVNWVPCSLRLSNLIMGLDGWQETDFRCQKVVAGFVLVRFSGAKKCHQGHVSCVCFFKPRLAPHRQMPNEVSNSSPLLATELDDLETCCLSTDDLDLQGPVGYKDYKQHCAHLNSQMFRVANIMFWRCLKEVERESQMRYSPWN